jgi:hypothetical protein
MSNDYGTGAKLSGNRRNLLVVRKTKGWDDRGYPIYDTTSKKKPRLKNSLSFGKKRKPLN